MMTDGDDNQNGRCTDYLYVRIYDIITGRRVHFTVGRRYVGQINVNPSYYTMHTHVKIYRAYST